MRKILGKEERKIRKSKGSPLPQGEKRNDS
jgi:hypothetical protein